MAQFPRLNGALLAPMAGINDLAFRMLCKEYGCGLTFTEMISSPALARKNASTLRMIDVIPDEKPFGIQLFGQKTEDIVKAAVFLEENFKPDVIDFNLGCPAPQVIRQGSGCALLIRKSRVSNIVKACASVLKTPFTVKIRSGLSPKRIVALDIAKACEDAGAAAITVHPRTMIQGYSGKADWDLIKKVKELVSVPVIGNGDVNTPQDFLRMKEETGCDYVMIGRAAMKAPITFQLINDFARKRQFKPISDDDRLKMIKKYLFLSEKYETGFVRVKLHCQHFTIGMHGAAGMRNALSTAKDRAEVRKILKL